MTVYKTLVAFLDLKDPERHVYAVGDEYPRTGLDVTEERLAELSSKANAVGVPLIASDAEPKKPTKKKGRTKVENDVEGDDGDMRLAEELV